MPELPEVETVKETLSYKLGYPTIQKVHVAWDNIIAFPDTLAFCEMLKGKTIKGYDRIGKYLILDLGTHELISHLRMEGKYYVEQEDAPYDKKHTHVFMTMEDGRELRYHDTRKFGKMYLYEKSFDRSLYPVFQNIGYDIFDERITADYLYKKLHTKKKVLKQVLLDQSIMAGIGNIYADEICFALKMHPETRIYRLRKKDFAILIQEARRILTDAIKAGGTTIRSYTSSLGVHGRFQLQVKVHAKKGEPCPVCGSEIKKITVATRGTCFCPTCQKKR